MTLDKWCHYGQFYNKMYKIEFRKGDKNKCIYKIQTPK
jgi:hypothetical protein